MKNLAFVQYNSPVVLTFVAISFFAMLLGNITDHASTLAVFSVYRSSFTDPLAYVRIFGHVFGHADFEHFFSNFLILLLVGPILEEKYGAKSLIYTMGFTAVITGIVQILFFDTVLLGASGIVFMFMILASFANVRSGRIPLTLIVVFVLFLGREIVSGLTIEDSISRVTHIVGGVCGAIFGFIINRKEISS
ncbi:MAG: rhomboid family intramembrane serine protease [Clostridiales bacterium]|jgi:membrane associated rhomboid family serine protease|nr:rhomboid family intramembrane serine protease [Clostridiales bacterium]